MNPANSGRLTATVLDQANAQTLTFDYETKECIGKGGYGHLYRAEVINSTGSFTAQSDPIVVKRINTMGKDLSLLINDLHGERLAMQIKSPYVNSPLGIVQSPFGWDIIFPELFDTNLRRVREFHVSRIPQPLQQQVIKQTGVALLSCICKALHALNSLEPPIHNSDLKPENFLLCLGSRNGKKRLAVSDFGLAYELHYDERLVSGAAAGTAGYRPPEALLDVPYRCSKSDIFCAAFVMLYWLGGCDPVAHGENFYDVRLLDLLPAESAAVVQKMLALNPNDRPSHEQLALLDPLRNTPVEPAAIFADTIRDALASAPAVMGLPLLNHILDSSITAPVTLNFMGTYSAFQASEETQKSETGISFVLDSKYEGVRSAMLRKQNDSVINSPHRFVSEVSVQNLAQAWITELKNQESMRHEIEKDLERVSAQVFAIAMRYLGGFSHGSGARKWFTTIFHKSGIFKALQCPNLTVRFENLQKAIEKFADRDEDSEEMQQ